SGGREHALAWAIAASPLTSRLFCAPGNAGIAEQAECVAIAADDLVGLTAFAKREAMDLVVIGPEDPLVAGLADALRAAGIKVFGPSAAAAALEGSKTFMKTICRQAGIPTAAWQTFDDPAAALDYVRRHGAPLVIKADGLTAGKGVTIAMTEAEAEAAVRQCMVDGQFGRSGQDIVVEAFLAGEEASFFALVDGETVLPLASAQDHKAVGEGDTGPNTGGMGAYSPAPVVSEAMAETVLETIIRPTARAMVAAGRPFQGVLYAGLMITSDGPYLLEYNVRFGDPETQVLCLRLKSDLLVALLAVAEGGLHHVDLRWHDDAAMVVVMATDGYPGAYHKGSEIRGLDAAAAGEGITIFHAATRRDGARLLANGGRVLNVCATGATLRQARDRAYDAVDRLDWPDGFCRRDIGWRALGED
ncbi:MAG: phosphoribosylamine--glycine ligase, partial [Alphaproteobacteria bacterium]